MHGTLSDILSLPKDSLHTLDRAMQEAGFPSVIRRVEEENENMIEKACTALELESHNAEDVREGLFSRVRLHERELLDYIGLSNRDFDPANTSGSLFEKIAVAARNMTTENKGFFLKKEYAEKILRKRPPQATMKYLGYTDVEELLEKEDLGDVFSALRFTETDEWMHKTFDEAYSAFTPDDFEERNIELRVLGSRWKEIAEKYVAKKHHNVSHLKEFGIIFLNPIAQVGEGKFLRDFALLFHYFHEVVFYSKLFRKYSEMPDFNTYFRSLLRGDVLEVAPAKGSEWLIIQRYLWKLDPQDPRLFSPHVNPESTHWRRGQEDLVAFGKDRKESGLEFWNNLWFVGGWFEKRSGGKEYVSFELEDNAMAVATMSDGKSDTFSYHQHEAMWNKLFSEYVGGDKALDTYILDFMEKGKISLSHS